MGRKAKLGGAALALAVCLSVFVFGGLGYFLYVETTQTDQENIAEQPSTFPEETLDDEHNPALNESEIEAEFVAMMNDEREANGVSRLNTHSRAKKLALYHATDLSEADIGGHISSDGRTLAERNKQFGVCQRHIAENVYVYQPGYNVSEEYPETGERRLANHTFEGFVNSESHYESMVSAEFSYTGVAVVVREDGRMTVVQVFCGDRPLTPT
jgi:uncharacterized protein YkwD